MANLNQSEMALFSERMQQCARKRLDTADIVRDGDISTVARFKVRRTVYRCT